MCNNKTHISIEVPKANLDKILKLFVHVCVFIGIRILHANERTNRKDNGLKSNTSNRCDCSDNVNDDHDGGDDATTFLRMFGN